MSYVCAYTHNHAGRKRTQKLTKIQDRAELVRWLRDERLTNAEAAARYLARDGVELTSAAISMFRIRNNLDPIRNTHHALLPWTVSLEHRGLYPAQMLRLEGRVRNGDDITDIKRDALERWKAKLVAEDAVVHYEADTPQGWHYVPRREGVDSDLIRDPAWDDEGKPVKA